MRQSTRYVIAISCITSVFVLVIVKQSMWSKNALEVLRKSKDVHTDNGMIAKESPDISDLISTKFYYQKLCELDR